MTSRRHLLYHERQVASLCGVHCLNSLLQGPYFSEVDLSSLALSLDEKEREFMMEKGVNSSEFLRFMAEGSGNVDVDGNFSVQVLSSALDVWNLQCIRMSSPSAAEASLDPCNEKAFICHLQNHWFCIRRVDDEWYNFNSLYPAPEHLTQFYLSAYLATLQSSGWTIFTIRGSFPALSHVTAPCDEGSGRFMTVEEAREITESKQDAIRSGRSGGKQTKKEIEEEGYKWSSAGTGRVVGLKQSSTVVKDTVGTFPPNTVLTDDVHEPEEDVMNSQKSVQLAIRLPDGQRVSGKFLEDSTVADVLQFVATKFNGQITGEYVLSHSFPAAQAISDITLKLREAGIANKSTLILKRT